MKRIILSHRFMKAKIDKLDMCVVLTIPGQKDYEYIINKNGSLENKLEYYLKHYKEVDGKLVHSKNENIEIVDAFSIDFYMGE